MKKKDNKKGLECLNCQHPFQGNENFCPHCGQHNDQGKISVKEIVFHFLGGFFAFDNQFFKTIKPLLSRPGKVSKDYIDGKRKSYTSPFQLLLHTSILFFLVLGITNSIQSFTSDNPMSEEMISFDVSDRNLKNQSELYTNYNKARFEEQFLLKLDSLNNTLKFIDVLKSENQSLTIKDSIINNLYILGMRMVFPDYLDKNYTVPLNDAELFTEHSINNTSFLKKYLLDKNIDYQINEEYELPNNINISKVFSEFFKSKKMGRYINYSYAYPNKTPNEALHELNYSINNSNLFLYHKALEINKLLSDSDFRNSYLNSIVSKTSIALFFLLPLFTLVFWVLYIRHNYTYTEHLIVVFNLQTVFFILLLISFLLDIFFKTSFFKSIFNFIFLWYLYKTLRNFYNQNHFKTLLKFFIINILYFIFGILGFLIVSFFVFIL